MFLVKYDQWFRTKMDDVDYYPFTRKFDLLCDAIEYANDVVNGKYRGYLELKVKPEEISISMA